MFMLVVCIYGNDEYEFMRMKLDDFHTNSP